jgi:hypothetical protein
MPSFRKSFAHAKCEISLDNDGRLVFRQLPIFSSPRAAFSANQKSAEKGGKITCILPYCVRETHRCD